MGKLTDKRMWVYGFLIWLVPFVAAFVIFPWRENNRPLFESAMAVILVGVTVWFTQQYFKNKQVRWWEGLLVGLIWMCLSIVIDLPIFVLGPIKMGLLEYLADIGLTYLIIPIICLGRAAGDNYVKQVESKSS